ncbi:unnamed protein product [Cyprideis torosa]|uniref:B-related factor 1 n=1 Tax=Cyprideis torosa TaxID=163714 RepID=A0A7R8WDM7_9CRUS|nr:unnamed protein product [Cyprideis torosa]CAG0893357.1 unnamed protein product [Cyprideis torosa]
MSSGRTCHHCGSAEIDVDASRGDSVCTKCGSVLENTIIVSEVQFEENAHGGSSAIGQFVSVDSGKANLTSLRGLRTGLGKESREITLKNAKRKISQLCQLIRLNNHCQDTAFNFYKMALHRRLTHGTRTTLIVGACVYITCRTEGQPHMLIDIADTCHLDVFSLGRVYTKLTQALHIHVPMLDPCVYILRFCHKLGFGEKTQAVSNTALRLMQRMKRDWMHTGRRPSGLCGAALLVAARMHEFNRSVEDVVKIVKIHESTLRKRLMEFGDTPSGKLTVEEFLNVDLEEEQDPPAFKDARKKDKERISALIDSQKQELGKEFNELSAAIEKTLAAKQRRPLGMWASYAKDLKTFAEEVEDGEQVLEFLGADGIDETLRNLIVGIPPDPDAEVPPPEAVNGDKTGQESVQLKSDPLPIKLTSVLKDIKPPPKKKRRTLPTPDSFLAGLALPSGGGLPAGVIAAVNQENADQGCESDVFISPSFLLGGLSESELNSGNGNLDLEGIDDAEIDSYLMSPVEVRQKSLLWTKVNYEYLRQQEEKQKQREREEEERRARGEPEGGARKGGGAKKKGGRKAGPMGTVVTTTDAMEKMLTERKVSTKINYDVLKTLGMGGGDEGLKLEPKQEEAVIDREAVIGGELKIAPPTQSVQLEEPAPLPAESGPSTTEEVDEVELELEDDLVGDEEDEENLLADFRRGFGCEDED